MHTWRARTDNITLFTVNDKYEANGHNMAVCFYLYTIYRETYNINYQKNIISTFLMLLVYSCLCIVLTSVF